MSEQQQKIANQAHRPRLTWYQKEIIKAHSDLFALGEHLTATDWRNLRRGPYFEVLDGMTTDLDKLKFKIQTIKSFINLKKQQNNGNN